MTTHLLVHGTVHCAEKLAVYSQAAGPTIKAHGGALLGKGKALALTGEHTHNLAAVIQFPDNETAKAWYASPEYQALLPLRDEAMDCVFVLTS